MSKIIELIITFVVTFLACLAGGLPVAYIEMRKLEKHIANKMSTFRENRAARSQSLKEVHAQVDEIGESLDSISKSLDRMNESMDRTIEFKRLMRDYSDYKIKRTEARENFCESQFWDEKNIH